MAGIVSFGPMQCGQNAPAVHAHILHYREWIDVVTPTKFKTLLDFWNQQGLINQQSHNSKNKNLDHNGSPTISPIYVSALIFVTNLYF